MDCDFEMLVPELRDLFDAVAEGCDGAIGSRFSYDSVLLNYPAGKLLGNRAFHALVRLLIRSSRARRLQQPQALPRATSCASSRSARMASRRTPRPASRRSSRARTSARCRSPGSTARPRWASRRSRSCAWRPATRSASRACFSAPRPVAHMNFKSSAASSTRPKNFGCPQGHSRDRGPHHDPQHSPQDRSGRGRSRRVRRQPRCRAVRHGNAAAGASAAADHGGSAERADQPARPDRRGRGGWRRHSTPADNTTSGDTADTGVDAPAVAVVSDERAAPAAVGGEDLPFTGANIGIFAAIGAALLALASAFAAGPALPTAKP